jgi:hypothetical protein
MVPWLAGLDRQNDVGALNDLVSPARVPSQRCPLYQRLAFSNAGAETIVMAAAVGTLGRERGRNGAVFVHGLKDETIAKGGCGRTGWRHRQNAQQAGNGARCPLEPSKSSS